MSSHARLKKAVFSEELQTISFRSFVQENRPLDESLELLSAKIHQISALAESHDNTDASRTRALKRAVMSEPFAIMTLGRVQSSYSFSELKKALYQSIVDLRESQKSSTIDIAGKAKTFSITQVLPNEGRGRKEEVKRLRTTMSPLKTNETRIQIIEIIKSSDPRYNYPEANEAFAKELAGLIDQGVFKVVIEEELRDDPNVLGAWFILCIKDINTGNEKFKARFIVQGHTDSEKEVLLHPSPTISQRSIRLLVALAAIHGFRLCTQDVTQAYLQSALKLSRDIYLKAPKEFGLASNELLKLLKPLYGISDSGDYWHERFKLHLRKDLLMKQTDGDLALWFKGVGKALQGLIGVYVDDQLGCGTKEFVKYSEETEKKFKSRARCFDKLHFAGIEIDTLQDGSILMHQEPHAKKLKKLEENYTFDDFRSISLAHAYQTRRGSSCEHDVPSHN